jgi:hypothetical protein
MNLQYIIGFGDGFLISSIVASSMILLVAIWIKKQKLNQTSIRGSF